MDQSIVEAERASIVEEMTLAMTEDSPESGNVAESLVYGLLPHGWIARNLLGINSDDQILKFRALDGVQSHAVYQFLRFLADHEHDEYAQWATIKRPSGTYDHDNSIEQRRSR